MKLKNKAHDYTYYNYKAGYDLQTQSTLLLGFKGDLGSDWVLLDLGDVIVHAMTTQARGFYQLEKLWSIDGDMTEDEQDNE